MGSRISHQKIAEHLRGRIKTGTLKRGDRLPSFEQLHRQFGVAPRTVSKALGVLALEDLVTRRPGSGVYVSQLAVRKRHGRIAIAGTPPQGYPSDYWARLLSGLHSAAHDLGLEAAFLPRGAEAHCPDYAGVIWYCPYPETVETAKSEALPIVVVGAQMLGASSIMVNEVDSGYIATRHLIDLGHKRIGFMGWLTSQAYSFRLAGYHMAMDSVEPEPDPIRDAWHETFADVNPIFDQRLVRPMGFARNTICPTVEDVAAANMRQWLVDGFRGLGCTAIVAPNDSQAVGIIRCLIRSGYKVPEDVSVVGFDNEREYATASPSLTSVGADTFKVGSGAVGMLHRLIEGDASPVSSTTVPVALYARDSTAPPGGREMAAG